MKKILLLIILLVSMSALQAPAITPAQRQKISQWVESSRQKLLANTKEMSSGNPSPAAIARERECITDARALAHYMLRVGADKKFALALLDAANGMEKALNGTGHNHNLPNVVIINQAPVIPFVPYTTPAPSYFSIPNRPVLRYEPDFYGNGGTFYAQ